MRILLFKRNLILKIDIKAEMLLLNQGGAAWSLTHSDPILSPPPPPPPSSSYEGSREPQGSSEHSLKIALLTQPPPSTIRGHKAQRSYPTCLRLHSKSEFPAILLSSFNNFSMMTLESSNELPFVSPDCMCVCICVFAPMPGVPKKT